MKQNSSSRRVQVLAASALLALLPALSAAQTIYRIVSPDGRVTFSDRPPVGSEKTTPLGPGGRAPAEDSSAGGLPFELRQIVSRYPVTLYTGDDCEPCNAGRSMLLLRGVPFTERTIKTPMDVEALQRLNGNVTVPALTIGGQRLRGYSNAEWTQYLDAAGYPASSRLPSGYRNPPPAPLVPLAEAASAAPAAPEAAEPAPAAVPPPPAPSADNPGGIVF